MSVIMAKINVWKVQLSEMEEQYAHFQRVHIQKYVDW
jgi:hypothetical protein